MCFGHSISSPSLTLPINTTLSPIVSQTRTLGQLLVQDFYNPNAFPVSQPTVSKQSFLIIIITIIVITSCRRAAATICPAQACNNGSAQRQPWARPAEPGPISQYAPCSRPAAHTARRPDVRDRRQMSDRRQTASSLNAPSVGHNNINRISIAPCGRNFRCPNIMAKFRGHQVGGYYWLRPPIRETQWQKSYHFYSRCEPRRIFPYLVFELAV